MGPAAKLPLGGSSGKLGGNGAVRQTETHRDPGDGSLPARQEAFAGARPGDGRCEKQPLREIAIAANVARIGLPDGSGKIAFINSDTQPYHATGRKESGKRTGLGDYRRQSSWSDNPGPGSNSTTSVRPEVKLVP